MTREHFFIDLRIREEVSAYRSLDGVNDIMKEVLEQGNKLQFNVRELIEINCKE